MMHYEAKEKKDDPKGIGQGGRTSLSLSLPLTSPPGYYLPAWEQMQRRGTCLPLLLALAEPRSLQPGWSGTGAAVAAVMAGGSPFPASALRLVGNTQGERAERGNPPWPE